MDGSFLVVYQDQGSFSLSRVYVLLLGIQPNNISPPWSMLLGFWRSLVDTLSIGGLGFLFEGSSGSKGVFFLIHSSIIASLGTNSSERIRHECFKPESMDAIMALWYFLSVALNDSTSISASEPSLSLCDSFLYHLYNRLFFYVLSIPIFYSEIVLLPLHSVVGLFYYILHLFDGRISFTSFWNVQFCLYCLTLSQCLLITFLLPKSFDLSLQVALLDLSAVLFWSFHPEISLDAFPSQLLSIVVPVSLPVIQA